MKLPMVYDGTAYTRRLHPIECKINESLQPLTKVDMTLPLSDELENLEWVEVPKPDGKSIWCRVKSIQVDAVTGEKDVYLEHGACLFDDIIVPELNQKKKTSWTKTVPQLVADIVAKQSVWTVGTIAATGTVYVEPGDKNLMTILLTIMKSIPDYQIEFVQASASDWHVDIKLRPTTPVCEARLSRNLSSCSVTYDAESICTRVYCEGITGGKMDSANVSLYGLHEETKRLAKELSAAQKTAIVSSYLANHDHPIVGVEISGLELSQITGLSLDEFALGSLCRVAIPWLGITENEIVISKTYQDAYTDPQAVTVTLSNAFEDLSILVASMSGGGGGGGDDGSGGALQQQKRFETYINQTDEYIQLIATEYDIETAEALNQSLFQITSGGIATIVTQTGVEMEDTFDPTASYPAGTVVTYNGRLYRFNTAHTGAWTGTDVTQVTMQSEIYQSAGVIQSIVSDINGTGYSSITQMANSIELRVQSTETDLATISIADGVINIKGNQVNMGDYVLVTSLEATDALIADLRSGNAVFTMLDAIDISCDSVVTDSVTINGQSVAGNCVKSLGPATASGGTITIPVTMFDSSAGTAVTFNIADTAFYQSGVAAAGVVSAVWSGDTYTVTSGTQQTASTTVSLAYGNWSQGAMSVSVMADNSARASGSVSIPSTFTMSGVETRAGHFAISCSIADTVLNASDVSINASYSRSAGYNSCLSEFSHATVNVANYSSRFYLNAYNSGGAIELFKADGTSVGLHRWYYSSSQIANGYYAPYTSDSSTYWTRS